MAEEAEEEWEEEVMLFNNKIRKFLLSMKQKC